MKKLQLSLLFFIILFNSCSITSKQPEEFPLSSQILSYGAIAAGYLTYQYMTTLNTQFESVEENYPFAQLWYHDMIQKYPRILSEIQFVCATPWMNHHDMILQARFNTIYCPAITLQKINDCYKRKIEQENQKQLTIREDLVRDDEIELKIAEFLLLRQIYYLQKNTLFRSPIVATTIATLSATMAHQISQEYPYKTFKNEINLVQLGLTAGLLWKMAIDQELYADQFAYAQSCDFNIFNGADAYFELIKYDPVPLLEQRIQTMNTSLMQGMKDIRK